ncbi:MAG: hypothetical protein J5552_09235 [Prevotella sp.]|nr:hypothetical protein [Prevotella sp.]
MRITNKNGTVISDINSWEKAFKEVDGKPCHWREGRSAHALAYHFLSPNIESSDGISVLKSYLSKFGLNDVVMSHAEIEHESRFDQFRGNGRIQDMVIWAGNNDTPIVICIEAKVDECFSNSIPEAYKIAEKIFKEKPNSKAKQRIEDLCSKYYRGKSIEELTHIRYQLLYYLAGSLTEAIKVKGLLYMPVIVYHTSDFDTSIGKTNKEDYVNFMDSQHFKRIKTENESLMFENNIDGITVYSSYIEIDSSSKK